MKLHVVRIQALGRVVVDGLLGSYAYSCTYTIFHQVLVELSD